MVYCGKPSKACAQCRVRRTKCDTKKPSCTQCVRAGRTCHGYRDPVDVLFRDESKVLSVRRQRAKEAEVVTPEPKPLPVVEFTPEIDFSQDLILPETYPPPPLTVSFGLGTSPEEQASCFFFQNYVSDTDTSLTPSCSFQYLADIYQSEPIGVGLADTIASLGLAGLANFWKAPSIMASACIKYNTAMRTISSQLRDMQQAKTDQTLMAIMLLGLYEINNCNSRQSMETWTKHVTGATALIQLRGKEQLRTSIGYRLFIYIRSQVVTNCIQRHSPIPTLFVEWSKELTFETPEQAAATALSALATRYCNLRASMSSFYDYSNPERIVSEACALDMDYENWVKNVPLPYIFQTINLKERSDEVFSDHYHTYTNIWHATIWNHYRCVRLLVNELIVSQLNHVYLESMVSASPFIFEGTDVVANQISVSNTTLVQLCHDICASVPYFLGFDPDVPMGAARKLPPASNGNMLLWPLYSAGVTAMVSEVMRNWVAGRLKWISEGMGIRLAEPLAYVMKRRQDIITWDSESDAAPQAPNEVLMVGESDIAFGVTTPDSIGPDSPIVGS